MALLWRDAFSRLRCRCGNVHVGGSAVHGQAAITTAALVLVGVALWLNYRRLGAAIWAGVAGTVAAATAAALNALTLGSEPNPLWIIVAILALTAVLMALLLSSPEAQAYFATG